MIQSNLMGIFPRSGEFLRYMDMSPMQLFLLVHQGNSMFGQYAIQFHTLYSKLAWNNKALISTSGKDSLVPIKVNWLVEIFLPP